MREIMGDECVTVEQAEKIMYDKSAWRDSEKRRGWGFLPEDEPGL